MERCFRLRAARSQPAWRPCSRRSVAALCIGVVSLRTSGVYFIMITLAFAQLLYFIFVGLDGIGGDEGLRFRPDRNVMGLINLHHSTTFYYVVLACLAATVFALHRLVHSPFGLMLAGCRENEHRLRALGCATFRYKLIAFVIAGAIAGLAAGLFALHEAFVSPAVMHWSRSGDLIVMVLLGGMGTLVGPIIGAIGFLMLESFLPDYSEHWMLFFGPARNSGGAIRQARAVRIAAQLGAETGPKPGKPAHA